MAGTTEQEIEALNARVGKIESDMKARAAQLQKDAEDLSTGWDDIYTATSDARNNELSVFWTRYEVMAAFNVGLLGVLLGTDRGLCLPDPVLGAVTALGTVMAIAWTVFTFGGASWVMAWNDHVMQLEADRQWRPQTEVIADKKMPPAPKSRKQDWITTLSGMLAIAFAIFWGVAALNLWTVGLGLDQVRSAWSCPAVNASPGALPPPDRPK